MGRYADKLKGKRILIIGGTTGIGLGAASAFLDAGARVIISSSSADKVVNVVGELRTDYPEADVSGVAGDVRDESKFTELLISLAPLDHIVFCATAPRLYGQLKDLSLDDLREQYNIKFWGSMMVGKAVSKYDILPSGGSLTLTSGTTAIRPGPLTAAMTALNGGIISLTQGLRDELGLKNIRCNVVVPGFTMTQARKSGKTQDEVDSEAKRVGDGLAVGFAGTPQDLAEAYLYAVRADYVTGTSILIGQSAESETSVRAWLMPDGGS